MGLGGYLFWTAAAREISERHFGGNNQIKFLPIESCNNGVIKLIKSEIFADNPRFLQEFTDSEFVFPLVLNNQQLNYCKKDTPERAYHRYDKHVVGQICEYYGIENPRLNCEIYLSKKESENVDKLMSENKLEEFIVIEPQSNDEYSVNKVYPFDKWQSITDDLISCGIKVVQVGRKTKTKNLEGAINLTGKTTFKEAAGIISRSKMFVSSEGGLMHAARGVGTFSIIIYTGYIHPVMTGYPENINVWLNHGEEPCGMKIKCQNCQTAVASHDPREITKLVLENIS